LQEGDERTGGEESGLSRKVGGQKEGRKEQEEIKSECAAWGKMRQREARGGWAKVIR